MRINKAFDQHQQEINTLPRNQRTFINTSKETFIKVLRHLGELYVKEEDANSTFVIDDNNKDVYLYMFQYLTADKQFKGDLHKGLLILGPPGTGKTMILKIIAKMLEANKFYFEFLATTQMNDIVKTSKTLEYYYKRPLILDEIGREPEKIIDFGTIRQPFIEIITQRYNNQALTFATSNFKFETIEAKYKDYITDRIKQMFNIIELKGNSRRK